MVRAETEVRYDKLVERISSLESVVGTSLQKPQMIRDLESAIENLKTKQQKEYIEMSG